MICKFQKKPFLNMRKSIDELPNPHLCKASSQRNTKFCQLRYFEARPTVKNRRWRRSNVIIWMIVLLIGGIFKAFPTSNLDLTKPEKRDHYHKKINHKVYHFYGLTITRNIRSILTYIHSDSDRCMIYLYKETYINDVQFCQGVKLISMVHF